MLKILNIKKNSTSINIPTKKVLNLSSKIKHFSPAIKVWNNSIYVYNNNTLSLITVTNKIIIKLVKNYFNLYNRKLEIKNKRQKMRINLRRLSSHKIYVSKGEFKHTNDKVLINIYVYNRQKYNYLYKMKKILKSLNKSLLFKKFKIIKKNFSVLINRKLNKKIIENNNIQNNVFYKKLLLYCIKKHIKKSFRKQILLLYYKRLFILNKFKFKYTYLYKMINLIEKIYNKNVEFNIINLKYFYLNSDIYTESTINKITKNRKKLVNILKKSVEKVKIVDKKWMLSNEEYKEKLFLQNNIEINKMLLFLDFENEIDPINDLLGKVHSINLDEKDNFLKMTVWRYIKNKAITGVRLKASGRLSKRHTASRSISKLRYKGSLINNDSSLKQLSSEILRGNIKTNLQYTKYNSIARIGSFGLKGWISNN